MPIPPNMIRPVSNLFRGIGRVTGLIAALALVIAPGAARAADEETLRFAQTVFNMGAIDGFDVRSKDDGIRQPKNGWSIQDDHIELTADLFQQRAQQRPRQKFGWIRG